MKKLTLIAASLLAAVGVYAQGTIEANNLHLFGQPDAGVLRADGSPVQSSAAIMGQFYSLCSGCGSYTAEGTPFLIGDLFGSPIDGLFSSGQINMANIAGGQMAQGELRVWQSSAGATYEIASGVNGAEIGESALVDFTAATPPLQTPTSVEIPTFSMYVVPEPSVIALGLLGAGALLVLRRRK